MKIIRKILIIALIVLSSLIAIMVVVSYFYDEKIAQYAINEINKYIRTPVTVKKTTLTLLRKFPDATIRLRDVYIKSVQDFNRENFNDINTDTLLYAKDVFLQMNLIKLLRNQFVLREVHVNNGILNVLTDNDGSGNYRFWQSVEADETSAFRIELQNVKISGIFFKNINMAKKTTLKTRINKLILHGDLNARDYRLDFLLDGHIIHYISNSLEYLKNTKVIDRSTIHVVDNNFQIITSDLSVEGLKFIMEGNAERGENIFLDMAITGQDLDIGTIWKNFPVKKADTILAKYRATGVLNFRADIAGVYSSTSMPGVIADFNIKDGSLYSDDLKTKFNRIGLTGYFTNGVNHNARSTSMRIEKVNVEWGESRAGGVFVLQDLICPVINYQIKAELDMKDLSPFIRNEKLEYCSGRLILAMDLEGRQDSLFRITKENLSKWQYNGFIIPEYVHYKPAGYPLEITLVNGTFIFKNYLYINDLNLIISSNDLNISGRVDNYREYIFTDDANLWLDLNIYSPGVTIDSLISEQNESGNNTNGNIFPERIFLKSRFWFDNFQYRNFTAENVRGDVVYKPGWLLFNAFDLSSMDGTIHGNGFIEKDNPAGFMIRTTTTVNNLDINRLFQSFNNFGQVYIQDQHLKGKISGEVDFYSAFDNHSRIKKESILAESDVEIINGELIHFEPMLGLSKFIEVEELEHIRFSTLKNRIFIRQSEVIIPQMDIYSSALNISGSGTHNFDNFFSYKVNLDLSDLLLRKPRNNELMFEEHIIQDDGLGRTRIFLTIEGTPDDYNINYDRKGAMTSLKEKLNSEKVELKTILREEFGLFRNDTLLIEPSEITQPDFIFRWEDTDSADVDSVKKEKIKRQQFIIEWDDEELSDEDQKQKTEKKKK